MSAGPGASTAESLTSPRCRSRLEAISEPTHGDDVTRVGRVGFDLGAQAADVDIDEAAVAEVVVLPHAVEQFFPAEHLAPVQGELAEQAELGFREVYFFAALEHLALLGDELEVAED